MIKSNKGISLVSLIITIAVMLIIASMSIDMSLNRFEINNYNKMINDLELLENKISNYYLKYNTIPIARDDENEEIKYKYTSLDFEKNAGDNENYYIIDLNALEDGVTLNYGKKGFENLNESDDVYIINEQSHNVYYVRGIEMGEKTYHSKLNDNSIEDIIPPTKPEIKIISGVEEEEGIYTTEVKIEIIPGKDNWSGVAKTEYSIDGGITWNNLSDLENNILTISEEGTYNIVAKTYDNNNNNDIIEEINFEINLIVGKARVGEIVSKNSTINGEKWDSDNPIIPKGFKAINITTEGHESYWDTKEGPQVTEGLVISDEDSNEFVWIPVPDISKFATVKKINDDGTKNYKGILYSYDGLNSSIYNNTERIEPGNVTAYDSTERLSIWTDTLFQESFNKMVESVQEYKGFYVGRYEIGVSNGKVQIKYGVEAKAYADWYELYMYAINYSRKSSNLRCCIGNDMGMPMGCDAEFRINWR